MSREQRFTEIFRTNEFQSKESKSGVGSELSQTEIIRREIPKLLEKLGVWTLIDAPCGDCNWIKLIWPQINKYVGVDIVEDLIASNAKSYGSLFTSRYNGDSIRFLKSDIVEDRFPEGLGELLLCRDCLVHLSFESAERVLRNFANSDIPFLLTTTFSNHSNSDFPDGTNWYPINLTLQPFNLPQPAILINEGCTEGNGEFSDKSLGLWVRESLIGKV